MSDSLKPTAAQVEAFTERLAAKHHIDETIAQSFKVGVYQELLVESFDLLARWNGMTDPAEITELQHLTREHFARFTR